MGGNSGENEHFENPVEEMNNTFRKASSFSYPDVVAREGCFFWARVRALTGLKHQRASVLSHTQRGTVREDKISLKLEYSWRQQQTQRALIRRQNDRV